MLLDHDIFYLEKVETLRSVVCNTKVGSRAPAYATSAGKVMLAGQNELYIDDYCGWLTESAKPLTEFTITDPTRLREELTRVRIDGFAMCVGTKGSYRKVRAFCFTPTGYSTTSFYASD